MTGSSSGWQLLQCLNGLENLKIINCDNLMELPDSIRSLTSLRELQIRGCTALGGLPEWLGELRSLRHLYVFGTPKVAGLPQSTEHLTSLVELGIGGWENLTELPEVIQHLTSLQKLILKGCGAVTVLPEWIGQLSALHSLWIENCSALESLPCSIKRLTALQRLTIWYCPGLTERYRTGVGSDQDLISHIPDVDILSNVEAGGGINPVAGAGAAEAPSFGDAGRKKAEKSKGKTTTSNVADESSDVEAGGGISPVAGTVASEAPSSGDAGRKKAEKSKGKTATSNVADESSDVEAGGGINPVAGAVATEAPSSGDAGTVLALAGCDAASLPIEQSCEEASRGPACMAPAPAMVSASTGAMYSVLSKLSTMLMGEYHLRQRMKTNLKRFLDELTNMKDLLEKLAEKEDHDPLVRAWMKQVREMTYDLDDGLDVFLLSSAPPNISGIFKKKMQRKIEKLIQELQVRVHEAFERRSRYKLDDAATSSSWAVPNDPRVCAMYENASSLVGIGGKKEKLTELLIDGQQQLKVVPIVGFGGLGKTTLAMNVYQNVQEQFICVAFVSVGQQTDTKKIFYDILHQVGAQSIPSIASVAAADALREHLNHRRYFIVIDDVWRESTWKTIKHALPENDLGSRILVTTRNMSVAQTCCYPEKDHIFQMQALTDSEARALFFRRVFGSEEGCPPQFAKISDDILKKCSGVPLAIITMATLLARRQYSTQEWIEIRDSVHSSLYKDPTVEQMRMMLNLSYIDLPFHLKTCLLYLSMFPEDYVIDRRRLVRRWIAEGFISGEHVDLEKVGEYYLNELIARSLVQPVDIQYDGQVDACRVHDIILDLITYKSVEENFATTYGRHEYLSELQDKVRRLSLDCRYRWDSFEPSEITSSHVRSLAVIGWKEQMPCLANFRSLRVLDMENYGESESHYIISSIGRLHLLKYLRLHTTSVIKLPPAIGGLQYLETLDLNGAPTCILPESIVRLRKLIHLIVKNVKLPNGLGRMQSLQELSCVEIDSSNSAGSLQDLGNMSVLKSLGLNWCISDGDSGRKGFVDSLVLSLSKLITLKLQSLCIESADGCSLNFLLDIPFISGDNNLQEFQMKSKYFLPKVPSWVSSLVNLTMLRINIETVGEEVMKILGELPALRALFLKMKSEASEQGLSITSNLFVCLKQFVLVCSNRRVGMLMFEPGAMQKLEKLQFVFSAQEEFVAIGFHFGIQHLTSLRHLVVEIDCQNARAEDVNATEDAVRNAVIAVRNAVTDHPKNLSLELRRLHEQEKDQNDGDNDAEREIVVEGTSAPATEI